MYGFFIQEENCHLFIPGLDTLTSPKLFMGLIYEVSLLFSSRKRGKKTTTRPLSSNKTLTRHGRIKTRHQSRSPSFSVLPPNPSLLSRPPKTPHTTQKHKQILWPSVVLPNALLAEKLSTPWRGWLLMVLSSTRVNVFVVENATVP